MTKTLARASVACGLVGFPLWLLSYAWLPFAWIGREAPWVSYLVVVGEVGAVSAGALSVALGVAARRRLAGHPPEDRLALSGMVIGSAVLTLVVIPNIVGTIFR